MRVSLSRAEAMAAANWLLEEYAPNQSCWLSTRSDEEHAACLAEAHRLGTVFLKFARRFGGTTRNRTALFQRCDGVWFKSIVEILIVGGCGKGYAMGGNTETGLIFAGPLQMSAFKKVRDAASRRRGNNRLSPDALAARVGGHTLVESRHRKRLARRQRYEQAKTEWLASGGTILFGPDMPIN